MQIGITRLIVDACFESMDRSSCCATIWQRVPLNRRSSVLSFSQLRFSLPSRFARLQASGLVRHCTLCASLCLLGKIGNFQFKQRHRTLPKFPARSTFTRIYNNFQIEFFNILNACLTIFLAIFFLLLLSLMYFYAIICTISIIRVIRI